MMQSGPLIFGISGLLLLGVEAWATRLNRKELESRSRSQRTAYWISMSVIGVILTFASIFAQYSLRPNVRVFGVPFLYAVLEFDQGRWRDFTGPLTLPALLGNGAVAFLIPQLIAATLRIARLR